MNKLAALGTSLLMAGCPIASSHNSEQVNRASEGRVYMPLIARGSQPQFRKNEWRNPTVEDRADLMLREGLHDLTGSQVGPYIISCATATHEEIAGVLAREQICRRSCEEGNSREYDMSISERPNPLAVSVIFSETRDKVAKCLLIDMYGVECQ